EHLFSGAVDVRGKPAALVGFGIVAANEDHFLTISRQNRMRVDVTHQKCECSTQNRSAKQQVIQSGLVSGLEKIEIVAVWRERKRIKRVRSRRNDLGIAGS